MQARIRPLGRRRAADQWSHYAAAGVTLAETSARTGGGVRELAAHLRGKTAVFCGHSGVGKTSILRKLLADERFGRVGEVNAASGRGRHSTTGAVLLPGPEGSTWIDTPGVMNFNLLDVGRDGLLVHFPDLLRTSARCAADCSHNSPGCALRSLPRYESYRRIWDSLR